MAEPVPIAYCIDTLCAAGAQRQLIELVTRLDRRRFTPTVIVLHSRRAGQSLHFAGNLAAAGIPVRDLDLVWRPAEIPRALIAVVRAVRAEQPRLLHSLSHHSNHLTRLGRWLMPRKLRLLAAIRTDYNARQLRYERLEHRLADCLVTNSPHMARKLRDFSGVSPQRLYTIPNGLNLERFGHNPDPSLRSRLAPGVSPLAVMMARVTVQKSPHLLAEAIGQLKNAGKLPATFGAWVVGEDENDGSQAKLDAAVDHHSLRSILRQHPQTTQPEACYHAADFTVLPSLWEGLPNAVIESFAAGKPVLVSAAANAAELVEEDRSGWICRTNDVPHLAARLGEVLALPSEALADMAAACRAKASQFSMDRMVAAYEALYERMIGSHVSEEKQRTP